MKIYLPRLLRVDEAVDEAESAPVDRIKRDRSILVVEDDDDVRAYKRALGSRSLLQCPKNDGRPYSVPLA